MTNELCVSFPEKNSLGSLYTAEYSFPHTRRWVGEARGKVRVPVLDNRMLGVALASAGWEALLQTETADINALKSIDFSTSQFNERTVHRSVDLGELQEARLDFLKVGDAELRLLRGLRSLKTLWLTGTSITDGGMREFADFPAIANLVLKNTGVTDQGIANLGALKSLEILNLPAGVTNNGLSHLRQFSSLRRLDLSFTKITDDGLAALKDVTSLTELYLNDTNIGDSGMAHLVQIPNLKILFLSGTHVSDKGLMTLEQATSLEHVEVRATKATEIGVARLNSKLPKCAVFGP